MAYMVAQIDAQNVVLRVIAVSEAATPDESEASLIALCRALYGADTDWRRAWPDGAQRRRYPFAGCVYDAIADVFLLPRPFPSWTLDGNFDWQAPVPMPEGDGWIWNETAQAWEVSP